MAFVSDRDGAETKRQSLNLSEYALSIIQSDMASFGVEKDSTFLNRIIMYYCPMADASIEMRLEEYRLKMEQLFASGKKATPFFRMADPNVRKQYVDRLVESRRKELEEKAFSYEKTGERILLWLNKENLEFLGDADRCKEDLHFGKGTRGRGRYVKSLIEEYTRLAFVERERVFFYPFVEIIERDLKEERPHLLLIETRGHARYDVIPYKIMQDTLSTANYLVGYSRLPNAPAKDKKPCTFRISNIVSIKERNGRSAALTKDNIKDLKEKIALRGVQFMIGTEEEIRVRLTECGREKYNRHIHLRPQKEREEEGNVYVFRCTQAQAEFYFFRFGADAEVLAPSELREKLHGMYDRALQVYEKKDGVEDADKMGNKITGAD